VTGWLDAAEAAERLGVKPATLYAYVSRGQLRRRPAGDGRRSEYHAGDVADLAVRGRRARPVRPSDIVLPTAITAITSDGPRYRGVLATELAGAVPFEQVAEHLWGVVPRALDHNVEVARPGVAAGGATEVATGVGARDRAWGAQQRLHQAASRAAQGVAAGEVPAAAVPAIVAAVRTADPLREDLRPAAVTAAARALIRVLAVGPAGSPAPRSVAECLAHRLVDTHDTEPSDTRRAALDSATVVDAVRAVDAALVLLADHELAASTLAVRVAASSRCDPYAVVLAGVAVLSGPRHGAASRPMERAVRATADGADPEDALAAELTSSGTVPGFGHPLYEDGDPRGTRLLQVLEAGELGDRCAPLFRLLRAAEGRGLAPPNIDAALAGLTVAIGAPVGTGELLFTIARIAGWVAHALEQYDEPRLLRPRAVYTGP
jgi:citrate synthase